VSEVSTTEHRVAVIVGSVREGRFGPTVADWFAGEAGRREDVRVDLIDLAEVPLGASAPSMSPSMSPSAEALRHARVTHSYAA
jgi:NAD(P)H-dependent FMN reductase